MSESWKDNHQEKTPWGFSLEEAFEALAFRTKVLSNDSAFNEYNEDRRKIDLTVFGDRWVCQYPSCQEQRKTDKWCSNHQDRLGKLKKLRWEAKERRRKEYQRLLDEYRAEEAKKVFRERRLRTIDHYVRQLELADTKQLRKENLGEYKSTKKRRYSGPPRKGFVYRIYGYNNSLLYIGKTFNVKSRLFGKQGHADSKDWWSLAVGVRVAEYRTETEALVAEAFAITRERPKYNVAYPSPKGSRSPRRVSESKYAISGRELTPVA